jgi:serine/threonine-protein kinase
MADEQQMTAPPSEPGEPLLIGRYHLAAELARGGLATVYIARLLGDGGLQRTVAVKRLHAHFRTDGDITTMFLDEARVALRVNHPNVVHAVDVVLHEDELFIVMEYVEGASLSQLLRNVGKAKGEVPIDIASGILSNVLHGLHAAHTTHDEQGTALDIVHRDVSPQNVLVGADGVARVLDFGIAKTVTQAHVTRVNEIKGKLTYMAPEQVLGEEVTCKADIFSAGIVLWEVLTGHRLFYGDNDGAIIRSVLESPIPAPSSLNPAVSPELDEVVLRALEREPARRYDTAEEMAARIEEVVAVASARTIALWVKANAHDELRERAALIARVEGTSADQPAQEDISRSRVRRANFVASDGLEPPALAQALSALDAQRKGPPPRPWKRGLVAVLVVGVASLGAFGVWRRTAGAVVPPAPAAGDDVVSVQPLTVPARPASGAASTGSAPAGGALVQDDPAPASSSTAPRAARGGGAPRPSGVRAAPTASNRYTRF